MAINKTIVGGFLRLGDAENARKTRRRVGAEEAGAEDLTNTCPTEFN
jgi:hypothetical protein